MLKQPINHVVYRFSAASNASQYLTPDKVRSNVTMNAGETAS